MGGGERLLVRGGGRYPTKTHGCANKECGEPCVRTLPSNQKPLNSTDTPQGVTVQPHTTSGVPICTVIYELPQSRREHRAHRLN